VNVANVLHYEPYVPGKVPKILSKAAELHFQEDARNVMWKRGIHDDAVCLVELLGVEEMEEVIISKSELSQCTHGSKYFQIK
jgi:hypothetical protein